jgi:nicotinate-nucleotide pyrophosphorylase (carboxylating)
MRTPLPVIVQRAVRLALEEDLALGDVTTQALFDRSMPARAAIVARQPLVAAGMLVAREVFAQVDPAITIVRAVEDGSRAATGDVMLVAEGQAASLLAAERVALNFLQHLSGVASLTARFCALVRGYRTKVLDTRKTTPGLRSLEKWAVRLGGGMNHRQSLGDGILIKDNHLSVLRAHGRGVAETCRVARDRGPHGVRIIVEAQSLTDVREAVRGAADIILLDNMSPPQVREAIGLIKGRALAEVSGGITLDTAREMAATGADYLSIGALTHSAPAMDISLDLAPLRRRSGRR